MKHKTNQDGHWNTHGRMELGQHFQCQISILYFATAPHLRCSWVNTEIRAAGNGGPSAPKNQKMKKNLLPFFTALQVLCQTKLRGEAEETGWGEAVRDAEKPEGLLWNVVQQPSSMALVQESNYKHS